MKNQKMSIASGQHFLSYVKKKTNGGGGGQLDPPLRMNSVNILCFSKLIINVYSYKNVLEADVF